jgi:hypothetical protein
MKRITAPVNGTASASPAESWHALSAEEVLEHLKVHENGLTSGEAAERLGQ